MAAAGERVGGSRVHPTVPATLTHIKRFCQRLSDTIGKKKALSLFLRDKALIFCLVPKRRLELPLGNPN
jgi:hypothetical protein